MNCKPTEKSLSNQRVANRVVAILKRMQKNAAEEGHPVWKNIPLAEELYRLLSNALSNPGKHIDASGVVYCCDGLFLHDLLDTRDTPRLCLKFMALRKQAVSARTPDDEQFDEGSFLEDKEVERIENELKYFIDPTVTMEQWMKYAGAHLKFDPVERTPVWEEHIYEVEKECDKRLKGEPRGMGFCFAYWSVKRTVLAKHGIEWRSPSLMNPHVMFD